MPRMVPSLLSLLCLALTASADELAPETGRPASTARAAVVDDALREIDRAPLRCVRTVRLRRTIAADDRTVLFLGRREQFLNVLRHACPGLRRGASVSYRVRGGGRLGGLCRGDQVYPLLDESVACPLGEFHEITEAQAATLLDPVEAWLRAKAVGIEVRAPSSD